MVTVITGTLATIPEISITLVGDTNSPPTLLTSPTTPSSISESPVFVQTIVQNTRLVVPPRPSDGPSRRTLVQRGLRLGSFRLNCTESVGGAGARTPTADMASTRRAFNWSRGPGGMASLGGIGAPGNAGNGGGGGGITRAHSHRGHSRARSLNSLADLNETFKMNVVQPNNTGYIPKHGLQSNNLSHPRTPSIDLSILSFTSSSNSGYSPTSPSHHFASAL